MSAQVSDDPLVRVDITRTKDQEFTAFVQEAPMVTVPEDAIFPTYD